MVKRRSALLARVRRLENSRVSETVVKRMGEFERNGRRKTGGVFSELCFCILTANFTAERSIRIQKEIGGGFLTLDGRQLAGRLRGLGHRFPNTRAEYIVESRGRRKELMTALRSMRGPALREWIVKNIKGVGYKEASHFLRNIGFSDYAIIDFHIIDVLVEYGLLARPKSISRKKYLEIEGVLRGLAAGMGMSLGELDLYLWYLETGKVLK
ncbi:MAG: N-glycosylase/DNA lyase [Candidatus Altiarchaeota archaeon]